MSTVCDDRDLGLFVVNQVKEAHLRGYLEAGWLIGALAICVRQPVFLAITPLKKGLPSHGIVSATTSIVRR